MKKSGFSLLEMMIALSISSILLLLVMPMLCAMQVNAKAALLQTQLFQAIQQAQQEADLNHLPVGVCGSSDQHHCSGAWTQGYLIFMDTHSDGIIYTAEQILFSAQSAFPGRLHWRSFPRYRSYLLLLPTSKRGSNNGTFWYCPTETPVPSWAVVINKSGRARVIAPNKQGEVIDFTGQVLRC